MKRWSYEGEWRPGARAHLIDGEHVEVSDVVLLGQLDPGAALLLVNQLANVLIYKFTLSKEDRGIEEEKVRKK